MQTNEESSLQSFERIEIAPKKKTAFVCSGGAAKAAAFHLGVALALQEKGFRFVGGLQDGKDSTQKPFIPGKMDISTYVGSSAGSIVCSYLAAGYSLDNIFNSYLNRDPDDATEMLPKILPRLSYKQMFRFRPELVTEQINQILEVRELFQKTLKGDFESLFELSWLKTSGFFSTKGLEQYLREEVLISNHFQDYIADLFVVATQLNHSKKVVFGKYRFEPPPSDQSCEYILNVPISETCAASSALPPVFSPYTIPSLEEHQCHFIDGEIRDTLSSHVAIDNGADLVFASYTHQPYHYKESIGSLSKMGLPLILIQSIYLLVEQKINNHIHNKKIQRQAILSVSKLCKEEGLSDSLRAKICGLLEQELHHKMDVDSIYIHPSPKDAHLFFTEHFSLVPQKMAEIARSGFKAATDTLRKYHFADSSNAKIKMRS